MAKTVHVDHIAFVVPDLGVVTDQLPDFCTPLEIEDQPAEGTREQYVDISGDMAPMLLLMQPISDGPYQRALAKRGPGLHHIGCMTPSIDAARPQIEKSRLLLHPISLKTIKRGVIWVCRPGVPFLIEVVERETGAFDPCQLQIPAHLTIPNSVRDFFANLTLQPSDDDRFHIITGERIVSLRFRH